MCAPDGAPPPSKNFRGFFGSPRYPLAPPLPSPADARRALIRKRYDEIVAKIDPLPAKVRLTDELGGFVFTITKECRRPGAAFHVVKCDGEEIARLPVKEPA